MPRNVILTGGHSHSFPIATPALASLLARHGIESTISEDIEQGLAGLDVWRPELLTVYALRWSMSGSGKYAAHRGEWAFDLSDRGRAAIVAHLERGGGLLALHTALICFDGWPRWKEILGGAWEWGRSAHPPYGAIDVRFAEHEHPLTRGLPDFTIDDEVYGDLAMTPDVQPLMYARAAGRGDWQPMLWTRNVGPGRVVVDALGHDRGAFTHEVHRRIVVRAAMFAMRQSDEAIALA
jgi:uncharacterized protein